MKFFNKLTTITAVVTLFLAATIAVHAMEGADIKWDAAKSMTAALSETINVSIVDTEKELVGKAGPSPANFALTVMLIQKEPHVLMCPDYDLRPLKDGSLRPTYGALKASFGFGLSKDHTFENSRDALLKGPANISLYKLFDSIPSQNVQTAQFVYSEGGEGWGPAVTIPVYLTGHNSKKMELAEANEIVANLNQIAQAAFESKKEDDLMTGRFRDFTLVPLSKLLGTGSDQPAVLDENKLVHIDINGVDYKLWDESQMRLNLLKHVEAETAQFYVK